jgi:hypothetical protein
VVAGCDALLVCSVDDAQERALDALIREAERSPTFLARCEEASRRVLEARRRSRARPLGDEAIAGVLGSRESRAVADEISRRMNS